MKAVVALWSPHGGREERSPRPIALVVRGNLKAEVLKPRLPALKRQRLEYLVAHRLVVERLVPLVLGVLLEPLEEVCLAHLAVVLAPRSL